MRPSLPTKNANQIFSFFTQLVPDRSPFHGDLVFEPKYPSLHMLGLQDLVKPNVSVLGRRAVLRKVRYNNDTATIQHLRTERLKISHLNAQGSCGFLRGNRIMSLAAIAPAIVYHKLAAST